MSDLLHDTTPAPRIERHRHELVRRAATVTALERITPNMLRVTLSGAELAGFVSSAPDDHIKIFVPDGTGDEAKRDYTPRSFDEASGTLVIDFALHDAGPATQWALEAKVGDTLRIGGPRGSQVITGDIDHWVLLGDETALPAIGRRIEEAAKGTRITAVIGVTGPQEEQQFDSAADVSVLYVHRADPADPAPMVAALAQVALPPRTFVWIAAESTVARALRSHLLDARGHALPWLKASGYWVKGEADASDKGL
ncbi:NADPH-dependent ferric-chelate reductase [Aquimixticola soesokkakensis]|uniref:NADPH-dependent ferric-chelate reductase n=1 Tax=Aquimixticola soesokkakensis TaxID=1519096 RepID=A0A1Y5SV00_9RHOB|nr:siderophore-interacting protein [Aquimixticola soesokkakensis]SLN49154.1 NADPH-dependent ferric-chelate reductase [Aquimixticola soesokkakensis]